jgi:hypothetical protein
VAAARVGSRSPRGLAAALIDRLIHHAHMVTLKGKSYLLERGTGAAPAVQPPGLRMNRDTSLTWRTIRTLLPQRG